jgi:Domain of unknown function (DUF4375)
MKTLIRKHLFYHPDKYNRIWGIIEYINELRFGLYTFEEIDEQWPQASQVYYVDYYLSQVNNGGHLQYFLNSNFNPAMNSIVLNGLRDIQAHKNDR